MPRLLFPHATATAMLFSPERRQEKRSFTQNSRRSCKLRANMQIAIIVAMTPQGLIGKDNQIPWHLPADLQRFKRITMGHPIAMGRKTFESLPGLLPGRQHIVLTRNQNYVARGCDVAASWDQVKGYTIDATKVFVIGGADIYKYALSHAQELHVTMVHADLEGEIYFPDWDKSKWQVGEREFRAKDNKNEFDTEYIQYLRKTNFE